MTRPRFPLRAVAALFFERQHLTAPRTRRLNAARLVRFVEDAGGLQLDSINVLDRAHYLTVFSRFGPYPRATLDRLVYKRRVLFEYWAHAACLIATGQFAPWRRAMLEYSVRSRRWGKWLKKNRAVLAQVEQAIRDGGPLGSADFEHRRAPGAGAGWWNWKPTSHALDFLWMSGVTLVHSRVHFHKRFDLAERVLPDAVALEPPDAAAFQRWHLRRSLHAMGAATETDLRMYLTFPRITATERRGVLEALLRSGEVVEVEIEAAGASTRKTGPRWVALADDLPALARAARRRRASRGTTLLSPFDSFLWHRDRTRRLFGFEYAIEVYLPGHKRTHGYYSLPILHDGQLIGRVDAKTHRAEGRLEVKHVHFEPWFAAGQAPPAARWGAFDRAGAMPGLAGSLRALGSFVGGPALTLGRVTPAPMKAPLGRALAGG